MGKSGKTVEELEAIVLQQHEKIRKIKEKLKQHLNKNNKN